MCIRDRLTGDLSKYLNYYDLWSSYKAEEPEKILVASASIHGHTRAAAHTMAEKLRAQGAKVVEMDLTRTDVSYAVTEAFRCGKIVLACATYDLSLIHISGLFICCWRGCPRWSAMRWRHPAPAKPCWRRCRWHWRWREFPWCWPFCWAGQ